MAEPRPRTGQYTVAQADAKGLVRNGLIDSAANWDSVGKGKLRKGFLQTLDASEKYVTDGPIGQAVESLEEWRDAFYANRTRFLSADVGTAAGGGPIPGLNAIFSSRDVNSTYRYSGRLVWFGTDAGTLSFDVSIPPSAIAWTYVLSRHLDDGTEGKVVSGTGALPSVAFLAGSAKYSLDFSAFVTIDADENSIITPQFAMNGVGVGGMSAGSFIEVELNYDQYPIYT